jgi:hypothetical protein
MRGKTARMSVARPVVSAITVAAICLLSACIKVEQFVIPSRMAHGWIVIDNNRTGCPSQRGIFVEQIRVPLSGYSCTSSPSYGGLTWRQYLRPNELGHLQTIDSSLIHQEIRLQGRATVSLPCTYDVTAFYYGPPRTISGSPLTILIKNRSDCRGSSFETTSTGNVSSALRKLPLAYTSIIRPSAVILDELVQ